VLEITLETNNATFEQWPELEASRILAVACALLVRSKSAFGEEVLKDLSGNACGVMKWRWEAGKEVSGDEQ
jgi:hypothetical protein